MALFQHETAFTDTAAACSHLFEPEAWRVQSDEHPDCTVPPGCRLVAVGYLELLLEAAHAGAAEAEARGCNCGAFGSGVRRSTSPQQQHAQTRQVKARIQEDGMELALVVEEPPAAMHGSMQEDEVTVLSIVTADTDNGVDQPQQQISQHDEVPFSFEGVAAAKPAAQTAVADNAWAALAQLLELRQEHRRAREQENARSHQDAARMDALEHQLQALVSGHAAPPMQPAQQPLKHNPKQNPTQASKQTSKQPSKQPSKQAPQQSTQQPAKRPAAATLLYSEVVAATCSAMTAAAVSALLPSSQQPTFQALQGQWQQQTHKRKTQHQPQQQTQNQQTQPKQDGQAVGVDRFAHLCHFTLSGSSLDLAGSPMEVVRRVVARVGGGESVDVVDAVRLGPTSAPRYQFKVAALSQADTLVRGRGKALAGSGVVLSELLSAAETTRHKQYWGDFLRFQQAGRKVQFRRARLFVDGQLWLGPPGSAATA